MAIATFYPAANSDDGHCTSSGSNFTNAWGDEVLGNFASNGYYSFFRFANVTIPKDASISQAYIKLTGYSNTSNTVCNVNIYFHDEDNAAAPTNAGEITGASLTSAVAWSSIGAFVDGTQYDSPELKTILQTIVNRSGWVSGNSVVVQFRDNSSDSGAWRDVSAYNFSGGSEKAELHVQYAGTLYFTASINAASSSTGIQLKGGFINESTADVAGLDDTILASGGSQAVDIADVAGFDDTIIGQAPIDSPLTDIAGLDDIIAAGGTSNINQTDIAGLDDWINGGLETNHALADIAGFDDSIDALNWSEFLRENQDKYLIKYFCTLTGSADDTSDLDLKISQFQARKRDGEPTYLSVTVPSHDNAGDIADRSNGQVIVYMAYFVGGVEQLREEILRVDLENIRTDEGPVRRSVTLTGHRTESYGNQVTALENPTYKYTSEGVRRFRFAVPDPWLNPNDTVIVGDDEFRAGYITYVIGERFRQMEVTEAS